ncbi:MAG: hypothetical protein KN64_04245 [Sulfurovum sp. AS07-7]|nr:MAG: hypothetical protein KN64_04245 [Sulfurovum sp. AS07-7]
MIYHEEVENDLKKLGHNTLIQVFKKIEKIALNPYIGIDLGNKANLNLSGYKKIYVDNKRIRIVYKIIDAKIQIFIIAVGKREDIEVYKKASQRDEKN